ncbi:MAG: short-chain dehydrogenase/reductase [Frankiales bacterium]|nr:short-chain dehydrogenase/reductase [Frankiales bacterium]
MNKSVVVTGAGQGIGRAILQGLVEAGWYAVAIERDERLARTLAETLPREDGTVLPGDVTESAVLETAAELAVAGAPLGGWVNNAGIVRPASLHRATHADFAVTMSLNLEATFWGCAVALRTFLDQRSGGAIVNVSSIHGRSSFPEHAAYEMSKGGVDALTRNIAVEYGPVGIRANAVAPGAVRTPALERALTGAEDPADAERELSDGPPLRRIGDPAEIAAVVRFLLSGEASYLTGQSIAVDGGWTASCAPSPTDPELTRLYGSGDAP